MERSQPLVFLASCRSLLGAGVLICAATAAVGAHAEPLSASYELYFGGFHVLDAEAVWQRGPDGYRITGQAEVQGIVSWFHSWKGSTESDGQIMDGKVVPSHYESRGTSSDGAKSITLSYDDNGELLRTQAVPDQDWEGRKPLPPNAGLDTMDPLSVIAALSEHLQKYGRCEGSFAVFDGRKRYNLTVADIGPAELKPTRYSIYSGEARRCRLSYKMLGGQRLERNKYADTAKDPIVYVASPAPGAPMIPVRLEIDTGEGTLMGHLTAFSQGLQVEAKLTD